jgi:hypothetical protein
MTSVKYDERVEAGCVVELGVENRVRVSFLYVYRVEGMALNIVDLQNLQSR